MAALSIGTQSLWYHGTYRAAAAAILAGGFRLDVGTSYGRWYGAGVYVSERAAHAASWARGFHEHGVVVACRLAAGVHLDDMSRVDTDHIAALCRRYGPAILGKRPWTAMPANKHLSRRDWAALYAYHVHHPDNHIGGNLPREPWFHTISRIRGAIARSGGSGLYRTHGDDPKHPTSSEAIIFDPSQVIPVSVHGVINDTAHRYALGPAVEVASLMPTPLGCPLEHRAWDAVLLLQDLRTWSHRAVSDAVSAVAAYGEGLAHAPPAPPHRYVVYDPWDSILSEFATILLMCGTRLPQHRLLSRLHASLISYPPRFQRSMWEALLAAATKRSEESTKKAGGRNWSHVIALVQDRIRICISRESTP